MSPRRQKNILLINKQLKQYAKEKHFVFLSDLAAWRKK
jgi:hypothetical protein